jgi:aryl-alcohol dehydrogenase-like predicted oxidoreductase
MDYRKLGRSGLKVSPICLGGNVFGWTIDQTDSESVLDTFVGGGGNFIDTADIYSRWIEGHVGGESEGVIGTWLSRRKNRSDVVIATKVAGAMGTGPNSSGLSRLHILSAVDESLRRLNTDYIDLYQTHFDDPSTPLDETLGALDHLVRSGKVRYIGASNYSAWRLTKALWTSDKDNLVRFESLQPNYNLVDRSGYENELEPLALDQGLGVIPYFSLAAGFLTGKYQKGQPLPDTPRAAGVQKKYMNDRGFQVIDALKSIAKGRSVNPGQVALAWLIARPSITAPIASATSPAQTKDLLGAAELMLSEAEIKQLDDASAPAKGD